MYQRGSSSLFDKLLSVSDYDLALEFRAACAVPWADYLLNPRTLRGSDFLMRWSQGVWSEHRILQAVNKTERYFAMPYGPSSAAPNDDPRQTELYLERLEKVGLGKVKRPDLLIFRKIDQPSISNFVDQFGGIEQLPFRLENQTQMREILKHALLAIECENSLWKASMMPGYGTQLTPMRRLGLKLGLKKGAVLPTVIIKDQDRKPLHDWQEYQKIKIHVWQVFYDLAFGISLDRAEDLFKEGLIEPTEQTFQAPGGATTRKLIYKIYYHYLTFRSFWGRGCELSQK